VPAEVHVPQDPIAPPSRTPAADAKMNPVQSSPTPLNPIQSSPASLNPIQFSPGLGAQKLNTPQESEEKASSSGPVPHPPHRRPGPGRPRKPNSQLRSDAGKPRQPRPKTPAEDTRLGPPPISAVGRPSEYARALARPYAPEALATLVEIMRDIAAPAPSRVAAAVHILDRGFGKPKEIVEVTDETGARAALAGVSASELKDLLRAVRAVDVTPTIATSASTTPGDT